MAQTYSKPAMNLATAHAYAVGWNAAIEAAAKIAEGRFATWAREGFAVKANEASNIAAEIRELDRSMQAIDD